MLADLVGPWSGQLLRHRPRTATRSVLDNTYLGLVDDNRWSARGVRAWYFASDIGVVTAEYGRHIGTELPEDHEERLERAVFRVAVALVRVLDLRDADVVAAMGAAPLADWILDLAATQAAAGHLLAQVPGLQGLVVPSVAFLDRPERFNVVVYRDAVAPAAVFGAPEHALDITLDATGR